ncbi:hypothetical protein EGC76_05525 [Pseudidiomarina gelatinasegens]|uniref:Agmatine deiminase family protein n=1 Tax=Pseudidiomarina gelatinasegens TaxID=2487740 RepID=A0A451GF18_9GAMM|nr:agmatine deiminase family protein [Pseudidiomarina gelatinasegens]RWU11718.1 hypothetical protein EGC76_05525 [Pseudidiomarina gelatinasegens]
MSLIADWRLAGPLLSLWPFRDDVWREQGKPAQRQLIAFWEMLSPHYPMLIGVHPEQFTSARKKLPHAVKTLTLPYNDAWPRDIGPLWCQTENGQVTAHSFAFSAWHGLYPNCEDDQAFAAKLAGRLQVPCATHNFVFEGGAIATDGQGTAVVHGVSVARNNSYLSRVQQGQQISQPLGIDQIYWLDFANPADETGGHTDNQVQFLNEDTLVVSMPSAPGELFDAYQRQLEQIREWRNTQGRTYNVVVLPQPAPIVPDINEFTSVRRVHGVFERGKAPMLASYVNFVRVGDCVVVPQFRLDSDYEAVRTLQVAAPKLQIIAAPADEFMKAGGALHCMTLPLPAAANNLL